MSSGTYTCDVHCPGCGGVIPVKVEWMYDPGVRTFPNGDPGYPPTEDFGVFLPNGDELLICPICGEDICQGDNVDKIVGEAAKQQPQEEDPMEEIVSQFEEDMAAGEEYYKRSIEGDFESETRHQGPDQ